MINLVMRVYYLPMITLLVIGYERGQFMSVYFLEASIFGVDYFEKHLFFIIGCFL